jgi:hypothetical protein
MLDFEYCTPSKYPNHPQHCVDWLGEAVGHAKELWYGRDGAGKGPEPWPMPRNPVIYTYPYYAQRHQPALSLSEVGQYHLCWASYKPGKILQDAKSIPAHSVEKPWERATLCQHKGNDGRVPGIPWACDMQVFLGSQGEWDQFLGINKPPALEIFEVKE